VPAGLAPILSGVRQRLEITKVAHDEDLGIRPRTRVSIFGSELQISSRTVTDWYPSSGFTKLDFDPEE